MSDVVETHPNDCEGRRRERAKQAAARPTSAHDHGPRLRRLEGRNDLVLALHRRSSGRAEGAPSRAGSSGLPPAGVRVGCRRALVHIMYVYLSERAYNCKNAPSRPLPLLLFRYRSEKTAESWTSVPSLQDWFDVLTTFTFLNLLTSVFFASPSSSPPAASKAASSTTTRSSLSVGTSSISSPLGPSFHSTSCSCGTSSTSQRVRTR